MTWVVVIAKVPDGADPEWRPGFGRGVVSIDAFVDGETGVDDEDPSVLEAFDDYTLNFEDLGYWSAERDLDGRRANEVKEALEKALNRLDSEGVVAWKPPEDMFTLPCKWFGKKSVPGSCMPKLRPAEQRKPVLAMHLQDLLETARTHASSENVRFYLFI